MHGGWRQRRPFLRCGDESGSGESRPAALVAAWQRRGRAIGLLAMLRDKPLAPEPAVLALQALAAVAADDTMGPRFLALTGMDAGQLRAKADQPATLVAVLDYLMANEADLMAIADTLAVKPEALAEAARALGAGW